MTPEEISQERSKRLRSAFLDQEFGGAKALIDDNAFGGVIEDKESFLTSSAVAGWAGVALNRHVNPASPEWQGIKDGIARGYFKNQTASNVSDNDMFGMIAADYQAQDKVASAARMAAARGESWLGKFRELEVKESGNMISGRTASYIGLARAAHDEMAAKINPYRKTIKTVAEMARNIDTAPDGMNWGAMASELIKVPKEDRPYVLEAISNQAAGNDLADASSVQRLAKEFDRFLGSYLDSAASSVLGVAMSDIEASAINNSFLTDAQRGEVLAASSTVGDYMDLRDDVREISIGNLAKLKAVEFAGMNISGAVQNIPMTLGSFVPYVGAAVTLSSFQRSTYNEIRRSNPTMSREDANSIATISAPIQAITEIASDRFLFGRLPNLKRAFTQPIFSATGALSMFTTRAAIGTATEVSEEFAQGITPLAVQSISKALGEDLPGSDWEGFLGEFAQNMPELISTILPLAIVGAGTGQLSDFRAGRQMARSADMLIAAQYSPEAAVRISDLAIAGKWGEAEDAMRTDWAKINAKGANVSQVKATAEQRVQAANRLKSLQAEQANVDELQSKSPEYTASVTRTPTGWQVTTGEGTIIPVESAEAANQIYSKLRQVGSQEEADTLVGVIDSYYEQGKQAETVFTGEDVQASKELGVVGIRRDAGNAVISQRQFGPKALETVREEAEVAGIKSNTRGVFAHINGSNEVFPMRVADGAKEIVRRMNLYKSQAEGQPQVITFLHENFESTWQLGMANGTFSEQETRTAMRALLPAFEGVTALNTEEAQFINNLRTLASGKGNETMLRETVSEMVIRDVLGRDRQGRATGMKPGSISRAIEASVMGANTQEEAGALKSILAAIKAFTAYLKGVFGTVDAMIKANEEGKIGAEYDTFINKVLGIDEVKQMESQAVDEVKSMLGIDEEVQAVIDAGNMAFSLAGQNAEIPQFMRDSLETAKAMAKEGKDSETIRAITGWFPGKYDDKMRWEVPDQNSEIGESWGMRAANDETEINGTPLAQVLWHKELYDAYPEARSIKVNWKRSNERGGSFNGTEINVFGPSLKDVHSTLLHEIQHWIQNKEGFARGSSPNQFKDKDLHAELLKSVAAERSRRFGLIPEQFQEFARMRNRGEAVPAEGLKSIQSNPEAKMAWANYISAEKDYAEIAARPVDSRDPILTATEQYLRTAGEIESRDVQARQSFTPEQRKAIAPYSSENIAKEEAIIIYGKDSNGNGQKVDLGPTFSISPAQDAEYLELAKNTEKNRSLLQKMVDAVAKAAGYNVGPVYHGTRRQFNEFVPMQPRGAIGNKPGIYFSPDIETAREFANDDNGVSDSKSRVITAYIRNPEAKVSKLYGTTEYRIENANDAKSADPITYDDAGNIIPLSQRFNEATPDIRFSISPVAKKNLVTVHNLSENNLRHALKVGGLAVPSLAVVRTDVSNFDAFGEITLIARPDLVDPQRNKDSKVLNADVYSPRYPSVKTIFSRRELDKVGPLFKGYFDELEKVTKKSYSWSVNNLVQVLEDEGFDRLQSNHLAQYAYLRDSGIITPPTSEVDGYDFGDSLRKQTNELRTEIVNFVQSKVDGAGVKYEEKIPDGYTNSGKRRFLPHDLDTVVKIMTRKLKDGEGFNYGVPSIRAANAKPFKTLKAIQDSRDKIITSEEMEALKKEVNDEFIALAESALAARKTKPSFGGLDAVSDDMKALVQGDNSWIREMYDDNSIVQDMKTFVAKLRDMPTEYFEAKVRRAVQLQEFEAAVVPSGTAEDLKAALKKKGLAVREYEAGNGASRKSAIESASSEFNATFSISPVRNLNELSDQVEKQFAENPVEALEVKSRMIRQFTKLADKWSNERWTPQGNKIRPISEKRTVKSLDKEQAMRQAQREFELVNEGIDKLTPDTLMAYSEGVGTLEDDPLVDKMLNDNGRLMSKATAAREGRNIKDQYDDLNWIPPQWYSNGRTIRTVIITRKDGSSESFPSAKVPVEVKAAIKSGEVKVKINKVTIPAVGGIMPDVMANNLGFDTASEMWAALDSSIKSHRNAKEGYAKAEAAVKAVERAAFEQAKAEAQAWRDETDAMQKEDWSPKESLVRDLITLEAIRAMFPQEIRDKIGGFVALARKASEAARLKVLQKQLERGQVLLEKHLKEQYNVSLLKMLDKAAPVGKPGEIKKSKFIVTVQDELDAISEIVGMDSDDVTESITTNEAAIISAQTPEAADAALTRLNLLELFGGILDLKRTSSQEMEVAHEYLAKLMQQGREARKIIDEARSAKVKEMVATAKADAFKGQTGPETTQAARAKAVKESGMAMLKKFFSELSGFDAVLRDAFGPQSETARSFSERFTLNSNDFEDVQNERRTRFRDFARELYQTKFGAKINQKLIKLERIENNSGVTYLKNREVKSHKFTEADAAKIVADPKAFGFTDKDAAAISEEIQAIQNSGGRRKVFTYDQIISNGERVEIPLSQMDAVYISMALRQPGILEQQERHGYDQQTVDELDKYLTDEAKAWRRWMQTEYDAEYQRANEVYMRMFNARMPMIMFYAPLLKNHQGQQAILDPLNTGISSNSANPGSIKTRKGRTSSLRIESALTVFWAHFNQMEYWIANAEYLRDVQAVLLNPEVRESVVASHGEDGMATISAWIQLQMSRGVGKAAMATAGNKMFRNIKTGLTMKALALSYTTALKTLPSVFYSLGEIHMSKWPAALVSGMTHWNRLWKTNIIQRRLDIGGMPELRDLGSSAMPMSWMNQLIKYGSAPAMYADGVFTTFSAAMAYGVNYDEAIRQGASEDLAHKHAEERTALIVSRTAQPENWTQKSLFENDVGIIGSIYTLFISDPRQKMALTGEALNYWRKGSISSEEAMRKTLAYWIIPGVMFQLANAIGRSLFKGDDDEWEVVDFATAALVGQFQGLVLLGSGVEMIFSAAIAAAAEKITGEEVKRKPFWNSSKNPLDQAAQDLIKSAENLNDTNKDVFEKTWEVIKSVGLLTTWLNPAGAVPATVERVIKDTTNLFYGAED